ncbi:MAG: thioredoxin domain-containing protein [Lewinellaceae bacterium]|nr:thioredoxin domain-containing protein [Lewinellaceae bacterium]
MNQLSQSSNPYLLQHRDQPIEWYLWGQEALAMARKDDRPILVSIGYSTCHWCHVMAEESFNDKDVADYMNFHFINIKIDREERPDLDGYFMDVCQKLTGHGGWPLQVFLTPDLKPFFAGNYFPPEPDGRQMSWFQVMRFVVHNYRNNRAAVDRQGQRILDGMQSGQPIGLEAGLDFQNLPWLTATLVEAYEESLVRLADVEFGGFGSAPKFPNTPALEFLLERSYYTGNPDCLRLVMHTVQCMLRGGIYDQAGGGFARYAVDRHWKVPHFEKMLYDQALMIHLLAQLILQKPRRMYKRALLETLGFVQRELANPAGGWFAALDADSGGQEGAYYTWTLAEAIQGVPPGASWLLEFFDIHEAGNWEDRNLLWQPHELYAFAEDHQLEIDYAKEQIARFKSNLLQARQNRSRPHRDEKLITDWNALMVSAFIRAGIALQDDSWISLARDQMVYLLDQVMDASHSRIVHVPGSETPMLLSDYACTIKALLDLALVDPDHRWIEVASNLLEQVEEHFQAGDSPLFLNRGGDHSGHVGSRIEIRDEELPNANALLAESMYLMSIYRDHPEWRLRSRQMLAAVKDAIHRDPLAYASWYGLSQMLLSGATEIAIVGPRFKELSKEILQLPVPHLALVAAEFPDQKQPMLRDKSSPEGCTRIYVCQGERCLSPVSTIQELKADLSSLR